DLPHAPALDGVQLARPARASTVDEGAATTIAGVSAPGIFRPPPALNEPVKGYAPGSPERAELQSRLAEMAAERVQIPLVIGGERVETGETFEVVMPHDRDHVLADVARGDATHVERAIAAARTAHAEWARTPWWERAAVFLRAAELLAGPWRSTLNAATMLGQSKTAHQAEIDGLRDDRLPPLQRRLPRPHLRGAAALLAGRLEPDGVPAARGLRARREPVQLHRDRGQPDHLARADGQHGDLEAGLHGGALR